ncbi:MAG: aminotransferase class I/II-fold pyridoxal phosphate-dependent enzyme, partial [Armatimonadetes bacterium]|nr:aminotransferase class I/II-fold pyridoxal phosphate-dependent enzyme [Armatimonadota bacterium]
PCTAAALITAIEIMTTDPEPMKKLWENSKWWKKELAALGFDTMGSETPITPVYCGGEEKAVKMESMLWDEGVYALSICFPTVAKGKARIRTMPSAAHTRDDLERSLAAFNKCGATLGIIGA